MEGQINWTALPILIEIYGIENVELLHSDLKAIREHMKRKHGDAT